MNQIKTEDFFDIKVTLKYNFTPMVKVGRKWAFFYRRLKSGSASVRDKSTKIYRRVYVVAQKRPLTSFLAILLLLLALIVAGNFLRKPKAEVEPQKQAIEVATYNVGSAPRITVSAQVEKDGVVDIVAQSAGIVNKINVSEGQTVKKGQNLVSLSSNYQGANAASVQRQIAGVQAQTAKVTLDSSREIIAKQREVAQKTDVSADQLRDITNKSIDETKSLISVNESILSTIEGNIADLESTNVGGTNDALILQTKQLQIQFLAATNQARGSLRSSELQVNDNSASLSDLQKDITVKQLDLQEKTLKLQADSAFLQARLAQINESLMFPSSPFVGVIEKVHVKVGQQVTPGTQLVTISSNNKSQTVVAYVPQNIARSISKLGTHFLVVNNQKAEVTPVYISTEAVSGQLFAVIYSVPENAQMSLTDKDFVEMEIPVGYSYTSAAATYIPIDAVHQTQDKSVVFVIKDGKAEGKEVTVGEVQGNFIAVPFGLNENDTVITSRNIVSGDLVKAKTL